MFEKIIFPTVSFIKSYFGFSRSSDIMPKRFLKKMNFKIVGDDLGEAHAILFIEKDKKVIILNDNIKNRQACYVNLWHEFAHYIFKLYKEPFACKISDDTNDPNEILCNEFAYEMVCPFYELKEFISNRIFDKTLINVKNDFSSKASVKLYVKRIIDTNIFPALYFNIDLNKKIIRSVYKNNLFKFDVPEIGTDISQYDTLIYHNSYDTFKVSDCSVPVIDWFGNKDYQFGNKRFTQIVIPNLPHDQISVILTPETRSIISLNSNSLISSVNRKVG